jgi:hypothetical protein
VLQCALDILDRTLAVQTTHACQAGENAANCSQLQLQLLVAAHRVTARSRVLTFKVRFCPFCAVKVCASQGRHHVEMLAFVSTVLLTANNCYLPQAIWQEYMGMTSGGVQYQHEVVFSAFQYLCAHRFLVTSNERTSRKVSAQESVLYELVLSADELRHGLFCSVRATPAIRDALLAPLRSQQAGTSAW